MEWIKEIDRQKETRSAAEALESEIDILQHFASSAQLPERQANTSRRRRTFPVNSSKCLPSILQVVSLYAKESDLHPDPVHPPDSSPRDLPP